MTTQLAEPPTEPQSPGRVPGTASTRDTLWLSGGVALATGLVGLSLTVGADTRWLAALGGYITSHGRIPVGIPFAAAPTGHWVNSLVLAELVFHWLQAAGGDRALVIANLVAVAGGLSILAFDARQAGARASAVAGTLLLVTLAAFPSLAIARVQMFSLILFPALVALLRADERRPSARIWLALPLLALWSNLHGAALSGLAVLWAYLIFSRARQSRITAFAVALTSLVAVCVTPAGLSTISYYQGLLTNVAAQRGVGQWAPLGSSPFDWVMLLITVLLIARLRRCRPRLWEIVVMVGLAALTVKAARDGIWLLFFLVAPASLAVRPRPQNKPNRAPQPLAAALLLLGLILVVADLVKAPHPSGASTAMVKRAVQLAHGSPVLADGLPAEQLALAGGRIWSGNPLDAFSRRIQSEYVDFLTGSSQGRAALGTPAVRFVLVTRGSAADTLVARDSAYRRVASDSSSVLYARSS